MPETWRDIAGATTAPHGMKWQSNGKSLFAEDYRHRLAFANAEAVATYSWIAVFLVIIFDERKNEAWQEPQREHAKQD